MRLYCPESLDSGLLHLGWSLVCPARFAFLFIVMPPLSFVCGFPVALWFLLSSIYGFQFEVPVFHFVLSLVGFATLG